MHKVDTLHAYSIGMWASRAIQVAAQLGIADLLKDGARNVAELAEATGTHAPSLYRLLRVLASLAVFVEPDKIEQKMYCTLTPEQTSLYEAVVKDVTEQLNEAEGIQRKGLILSTLLKLKQICNHPAQFLTKNRQMK